MEPAEPVASSATDVAPEIGAQPGGRILLAAGGTGGHIYPAIALAEALHEIAPSLKIQFCCGARPAELQIYRREGIRPWVMPVSHNRPGLVERLRFIQRMLASWRKTRRRLRRHPVKVAVGFGSYVSFPPLLAARMSGARLILHEQNVRPGTANRLLAPLARWIGVADEAALKGFPAARTGVVGNPVRLAMLKPIDRAEARRYFRLGQDRLVCLCLGGSQGAVGINRMLMDLLARLAAEPGHAGRWQLLWSTGPAHFSEVSQAIRRIDGLPPNEHVLTPYIERMAMAYAAADLVLGRAGALTLAELTALGKPAVLVPLPSAKGGHQESNARQLAARGAAVVIDQNDPEASAKLHDYMERWALEPQLLEEMGAAARRLGRPHAAAELARVVMDVLRETR